ncbi:hypothetical protein, partial [Thiolapillus sp.]|uniref:hypothetical protein n=2 Tax=Thiolapillus sp. TaxID=2017437 RepID=UPI003AF81182
AWWGDSLTRPRLDISGRPSARGGAILSLAPGWTSPVILRRVVGRFSHSPQAGHLRSSFGAWWGNSLTRPRLDTPWSIFSLEEKLLLTCSQFQVYSYLKVLRKKNQNITSVTCSTISVKTINHSINKLLNKNAI